MAIKIMVVDDSILDRTAINKLLDDYDITCATCGEDMWKLLEHVVPALILLDVVMPGENGFQIAKKLTTIDRYSDIPIIFITSKESGKDVEEGFDSGGMDYIKKPFNEIELRARIRSVLAKKRQELELREKTITDPLTGIYNRRYFFEVLDKNMEHARRNPQHTFSTAIVDIDHFKNVNDANGHLAGDSLLRQFSEFLKRSIRPYDILARYGGEEFVVLFKDCSRKDSGEVLGRIKDAVEQTAYRYQDCTIRFTFSGGISDLSDLNDGPCSADDLIRIADERLYAAKQTGRNRIVID